MTRDEKLALLRDWIACHNELSAQWEEFSRLTGASTDARFGAAVWDAFSGYTQSLARLLEAGDDLDWYWLENNMGQHGRVAGVGDNEREIRTADDLLWLIETEDAHT